MNPTRLLPLLLSAALAPAFLVGQEPGEGRRAGPFTVLKELPRRASLDQGNTGTCWCFATTSFLETEVQRMTGREVDLSEMWIVRQALLEKARRFVMLQGKTQLSEGGLSHDVPFLAARHGLVPAEAYPGLPSGQRGHDHEELFRLTAVLKELTTEGRPPPSGRWEAAVAGMVDGYLGTPPERVKVEGRELTPEEYVRDVLKLGLDDYAELMSYGYAPWHRKAELLVPDNWLHYGDYQNVPVDEFMAAIDGALERGFSVALDIDVSEPGYQSRRGVARLVPEDLEAPGAVTQELRDRMFLQDKSTTDDHLMHIVGLAKDEGGRRFYLTKDSGGPGRGPYEGHCFISAAYVRAKALGFMVHKDALAKPAR